MFHKIKTSKNVGLTFDCFISAIILLCSELGMDIESFSQQFDFQNQTINQLDSPEEILNELYSQNLNVFTSENIKIL